MQVCRPRVLILGQECHPAGRSPDHSKVQKILDWPHAAYSFLYSAAYSCSLCLLIYAYPLLTDRLQSPYKALTNHLPIPDKFCLLPSLFVL